MSERRMPLHLVVARNLLEELRLRETPAMPPRRRLAAELDLEEAEAQRILDGDRALDLDELDRIATALLVSRARLLGLSAGR
ncbi:hypothetical protein [Homoserinibacter sp. YIM 151385]|uniref:hypothetical protein n=1 Tax=Homoserinibacter sp. YIM 151385 TaxID=2985506 RepID=UPI0022F0ED4A|nr:hypothetical protein [Homoserinibacter sp. YIM 151385]WBU37931.1 hypothetical protein OF852_13605 [Homoserinibacter sp. YIM 151385]